MLPVFHINNLKLNLQPESERDVHALFSERDLHPLWLPKHGALPRIIVVY